MNREFAARMRRWLIWIIPPYVAALWAGATTIAGGNFEPWAPAMIDLDVYRRAAEDLLAGRDFYATPYGKLPWIYPPFAAFLAVPCGVVPLAVAQFAWLFLNVTVLMGILYRLGFGGWRLSLLTTAAVWLVEPVRETLGFGQLGIILVGAAVLDSAPGRRLLGRRILPEGWLVGLATAVKLTPATVAAYNFFSGRRKPGLMAFAWFCGATALTWLLLPGASRTYWLGLVGGNSGINSGIEFKTNQSVMGVWARLFGELSRGGLVISAIVALVGIAAAVAMHKAGEATLAICLAGFTSLLASPISWSHHYVWVVPLAAVLLRRPHLPQPLRLLGLFYCIWTAYAPFKQLPGGEGVERTYPPLHQVVDNIGVVAGVALLVMGLLYGLRGARAARSTDAPDVVLDSR